MSTIESITTAIMADPQNKAYTDKGIEPLLQPQRQLVINITDKLQGEDGRSWYLLEG